jgi:hypothetical protein
MIHALVSDVDFQSQTVLLRERKRAKGRATIRRVPLTPQLVIVLEEWIAVHPGGPHLFAQAAAVAHSKTAHNGVTAITPDEAHDHFKRALAGTKWSVVRGYHVFRHSFISLAASRGVDQRVIDEWVGHQTDEQRRRYRHLYRTFHVGKLDCVKAGPMGPSDFGWEEWTGGGGYEHRDPMIFQTGNNRRGQGWTGDIWTEETLKFIRGYRDAPWFASVADIIPHMPWVYDEKYAAPFLAQGCSKDLAACYGSVAQRDECIGRLLDGLRETGQEERTIVVFVSDNGMSSPEVQELATKDPQA